MSIDFAKIQKSIPAKTAWWQTRKKSMRAFAIASAFLAFSVTSASAFNAEAFVPAPGYGYTDPGYVAPSYTDPGYVAPSYTDPGYVAPSYTDPGYDYIDPGFQPAVEFVNPTNIYGKCSNSSGVVGDCGT
ncbi:hypothetical protein N9J72_00190 [Candidatus Gracilibacteria bacterium]|nr:hypothetical protein [Candidatus Gracilibacteria bacterium]